MHPPPPPTGKGLSPFLEVLQLAADIMHYAEHEEDVQNGQDALRRTRKQERLDDGQLTIYNAMAKGRGDGSKDEAETRSKTCPT